MTGIWGEVKGRKDMGAVYFLLNFSINLNVLDKGSLLIKRTPREKRRKILWVVERKVHRSLAEVGLENGSPGHTGWAKGNSGKSGGTVIHDQHLLKTYVPETLRSFVYILFNEASIKCYELYAVIIPMGTWMGGLTVRCHTSSHWEKPQHQCKRCISVPGAPDA